jgi:tol-pal system protein YbgF
MLLPGKGPWVQLLALATPAGVALALFASCTLTERAAAQQGSAASGSSDLAAKVTRLEQAIAELQRAGRPAGPDPDLLRRAETLGKSLAELRQRMDASEAALPRVQDRTEQLERTMQRDENRVRMEELENSVRSLGKKVQELEARMARVPAPAPPPPALSSTSSAVPATERSAPSDRRPSMQAMYDDGYGLLKQGKHEQARDRFGEFIRTYPDTALIPNAYFWTGESYYEQKLFEQAILEYDKVIQKFPKSDKVPSALLKQAFAFDALGDPVDARILLKKLLRDYATSDQAVIAKKKLEVLGE